MRAPSTAAKCWSSGTFRSPLLSTFLPPSARLRACPHPRTVISGPQILRPETFEDPRPRPRFVCFHRRTAHFLSKDLVFPSFHFALGVFASSTQQVGALYLTHPTWGVSFAIASIFRRPFPAVLELYPLRSEGLQPEGRRIRRPNKEIPRSGQARTRPVAPAPSKDPEGDSPR
jgi:hypothetical protein